MQIGSIVRSVHIAVPQGARGIVMRILGDMAMVAWYADEPGTSELLNTEPFFLEDLIDTGELVRPTNALMHLGLSAFEDTICCNRASLMLPPAMRVTMQG
jgi:hypothetical protein